VIVTTLEVMEKYLEESEIGVEGGTSCGGSSTSREVEKDPEGLSGSLHQEEPRADHVEGALFGRGQSDGLGGFIEGVLFGRGRSHGLIEGVYFGRGPSDFLVVLLKMPCWDEWFGWSWLSY
jgi:hypothetical protein